MTVQIDDLAPNPPRITTYLERTNLPYQAWTGTAEPGATMKITGAAEPLELVVDVDGHFRVNVPLTAGLTHAITVVMIDADGNESEAHPFPITQDPGFKDSGALHPADGDNQRGVVNERLLHPIKVRATDNDGRPLVSRAVMFDLVEGLGSISPEPTGSGKTSHITLLTDSEGYADVYWWMGPTAAGEGRVCVMLNGDSGLPVTFSARPIPAGVGQTSIAGLVLDEHNRGVNGATVHLTGTPLSTQTDELGRFTLTYEPVVPAPSVTTEVKSISWSTGTPPTRVVSPGSLRASRSR